MTMASKHPHQILVTSQAFPRKRNTTSENSRRAACIEAEGSRSPTPCSACLLADKTCWISQASLKCSFCLFKNQSCSLSSDREHAELVRAHCSLNEKIAQAQIQLQSALENLLSLQEQKKKLMARGISGSRARRGVSGSTDIELTQPEGSSSAPPGSTNTELTQPEGSSSVPPSTDAPLPVQPDNLNVPCDDLVLESSRFSVAEDMLDFTAGTDYTADFEDVLQTLGPFPGN